MGNWLDILTWKKIRKNRQRNKEMILQNGTVKPSDIHYLKERLLRGGLKSKHRNKINNN